MIDSSPDPTAKRPHLLTTLSRACLALPLLLTAGAAALAQSSGTTSPEPTVQSEPLGAPTPLVPFDRSSRQGSGSVPQEPLPTVQGIEVDRLDALDPNAIGLYDAEKQGLGADIWRGSERARLETLLARLPGELQSRTLRDLARRLLLSRAEPPAAEPGAAVDSGAEQTVVSLDTGAEVQAADFLALRIDRLSALGEIVPLQSMLAAVPRLVEDERIQRARAETAFLTGDLDGGCREVRAGVAVHVGAPYWQRSLVLCQLAGGERAQAQLGLGLLQERGLAEDAGYLALFEALSGGETEPEVPVEAVADPLAFAALQSIGLSMPEGTVDSASTRILVAMALSEKTPLEQRIGAAERAAVVGAVGQERMASIYGKLSVSAEERLGNDSAGLEGARLRALLYQRAPSRKEPGARARALREALNAATEAGVYPAIVPLLVDEFPKVPVQAGLAWFADTAGRALFAGGRVENGNAWYGLAREQAVRNSAAKLAVGRLWPYYRLNGGASLSESSDPAIWREGLSEEIDSAQAEQWEALLRAAFAGLGGGSKAAPAASPSEGAAPAEDDSAAGSGNADLLALKAASEASLRGETLLLALALVGPEKLDALAADTVEGVLAALVRTGFAAEARALAIEMAVASGL